MPKQSWLRIQAAKRRQDLESIVWQVRILSLTLRHPQTPWCARLVAGCTAAYLLSPIQLIPTFIPVIGQLDDLLVLFIGMKLLRRLTPVNILADCEAQVGSPDFMRGKECEPPVPLPQPGGVPAA